MSSSAIDSYINDFGKPPRAPPPVSLDHIFHEQEGQVPLILVVFPVTGFTAPLGHAYNTRDQHWMFQWTITNTKGIEIVRQAQITRERSSITGDWLNHLTNWGSAIKTEDPTISATAMKIEIQNLTLEQRMEFLKITDNEGVRHPNGQWNCQDWCKSVLAKAVTANILDKEKVSPAIGKAEATWIPYGR